MSPPRVVAAGRARLVRHLRRTGVLAALVTGFGDLSLSPFVRAQSPAAGQAPASEPVVLEPFEITGSYIPYASTQTFLPVTALDAQGLADAGIATNLLEALRKTMPQFSGSNNLGSDNAGANMGLTSGGSMLSFRNTQTLVLVNGRRMAYAPALASGGLQFVDVNLIPLSAIKRVEVLQDGASATYGTDAIGGVVNILLRADFDGCEAHARYSLSPNAGHYAEHLYSVVGGMRAGRTGITFSLEYADSDPLPQNERAFSNPVYGTPTFAGVINTRPTNALPAFYVLNPALNAPPAGHTDLATLVANGVYLPVNSFNLVNGRGAEQRYAFNLADYQKLLMQNQRRSATLELEQALNARVTVFGDLIYARTRTFSALNAQPFNPTLPPSNASNPTTQPLVVRNRFVDHPRLFDYDSTSVRGVAGARGSFADHLTWEAAAGRNVITQDFTNANLVESTRRAAALANGLLNIAARQQPPGAIDAAGVFGTAWGKAKTTLTTADARLAGELFDLPAGATGFALGTEVRDETLQQDSDPNSQEATFNWDSGVTLNPFQRSRRVWSTFAEIRVPIVGEKQRVTGIQDLECSGAVRYERYSDTSHPLVPKVSLAWRPTGPDLLLRATYSRSFAAPTLFQLFGPNRAESSENLQFDASGGGQVVREFNVRSGSNADLRPSRSTNLTYGLVWSPEALHGFSATADWFSIKQRDLVSTIDFLTTVNDVERNGPRSPYSRFVHLGSYDGTEVTAPGQLSADPAPDFYVTNTLVNIADQTLSGLDLNVAYARGARATGRIETSVAVTAYQRFSYQSLPSVAPVETVGEATAFNGTLPRWRSDAAVAWSRGRWRANAAWQHVPAVRDPQGDGTPTKPFVIARYDSVDVAMAVTLDLRRRWVRQLVVRLGVNNVANRQPPFGGGTFPLANADTGTYNPIGRLVYLDGTYRF